MSAARPTTARAMPVSVDVLAGQRVPRLGHELEAEHDDQRTASGTLSQKAQVQSCSTSQPPTTGPDAGGDAEQAGPGADRRHPVVLVERRLEDREAAGHQQGRAQSLEGPGGDEHLDVGRQRAEHGGDAEATHAHGIHRPSPEPVTEGAAEQDERGQRQGVGVDHPLEPGEVGVEVAADRREGDVDDRAVEQGDPAAQDRGGEGQPSAVRLQPQQLVGAAVCRHGSMVASGASAPRARSSPVTGADL